MVRRSVGVMLIVIVVSAAAAGAASGASPPSGDAHGLALLARVHRAYEQVPAVTTSASFRGMNARFTLLLRQGVAVAEEFVGVTSTGTTTLVAHGTGPTYAREAGTSCWRRLATTDQQSLEDVGLRFPDGSGEGGTFVMHIDAKTMLVESETGRAGGQPLTNHITALPQPPALPSPQPTC